MKHKKLYLKEKVENIIFIIMIINVLSTILINNSFINSLNIIINIILGLLIFEHSSYLNN